MKKFYLFLHPIVFVVFFIISVMNSYGQAPSISSVSPSSGGVGASVIISGSNFSATAANNVVYFGAVLATVTSASTSQLTVTVPAGASYGPVTVYNTGGTVPLVGTSGRAFFTPTFTSRNSIISADFDSRTDITINSAGASTKQLSIADLNGDGLPDMVVADLLAKTLLIFQHATNPASFGAVYPATGTAFAYTGAGTNAVSNFVLADMNGDGKPDLVMSVNSSTYIYLNTSTTGGAVSFSTTSAITPFGTSTANELAVADMDGDGRPDIMTCNGNLGTVKLYQNITSGSTLSFNTTAVSIYPGNSSSTAATDATHYCYSMLIGDMDGDGKPDIVVANQQATGTGTGYVSIIRNISSGPGTLTAASFSAGLTGALLQTGQQIVNNNANNIALGDIDGDGKLDIVVAEATDKTVSVIQNNSTTGSFSFGSRVTMTTSTTATPRSVALADIDGDGRVDLIVDNYLNSSTAANFAIFRNLSTTLGALTTSSFATAVTVQLGENSSYLVVNDIDGDGRPDLISSNAYGTSGSNGTVTLWHNNPITPVVISTVSPASGSTAATGTSTSSLATGTNVTLTGSNFNSTAANNLVFFGATKATVSSATATQLTVNVPPGASYGPVSVTNTALNSVTSRSVSGQSQAVFKPTFTSKGNITTSDFDTRIDLALTATTNVAETNATGNKTVIVKDVDGDGLPDIITIAGGNTVMVFHQINTGTVTNLASASFSTAVSYSVGSNITQLVVADVDGDGLPDILAASDGNQEISLLHNTNTTIGTPSFATVVNLNPGSTSININSIQLADIDGDGKPDLIAISNGTNSTTYTDPLFIYRNVSTPGAAFSGTAGVTFAAVTFITNVPGYVAANNINVSAADLDGDGKPDLVISAGSTNNTLYIYHNNSTRGNLSFDNIASPITIATGNSPQFAAVGDLDGDGLLDIAVPNGNDNTVSLFRNTSTSGSISFNTTATVVATGTNPVFVTLADIDGDGKADVLAANNPSASRSISILRNTSTSGAISTAAKVDLLLPTSTKAYSIAVNDLDLDGKADIVVANSINPGISLFRNNPKIPILTASSGSASYATSSGTPIVADPGITVTENNQTTLSSATVSVTTNFISTEDVLSFNNNNATNFGNIAASYSVTTGVLTLTSSGATATILQFQNALQAVTYSNSNASNPNLLTRTVSFVVNDGGQNSSAATRNINIISAQLSNLTLSSGSLTPAFSMGTYTYTQTVANNITSLTVTPTPASSNSTVTVNGVAVTGGGASGNIGLSVGTNTITTLVTAQDGTTTASYTVTITRQASSNANLANLVLSSGPLSPAFNGGTTGYSATVANNVTSINVTPTTADATATITVNGVSVASGNASANTTLNVGPNTITVAVTAQDGVTILTYTVTVNRLPSSNAALAGLSLSGATLTPTFSGSTYNYGASVSNATTSITITPTLADATATLTVNGNNVASGSTSGSIALAVGTNTITVLVTAQDGTTQLTYTTTVTRVSNDASLSGLALSSGSLSPVFTASTTSYTASVLNTITSINLTPTVNQANATVKINGTAVASGAASGSILLNVGTNTISTVVIAQDGTTNTYTLVVTRAQSPDATLSALVTSAGTLSPTFVSGTTNYTISVANSVTGITITPTVNEPNSTVKVNGTPVISDTASGSVNLVVGVNAVNVLVTAQNGTQKTYSLSITRAASSNASLSALSISSGTLTPTFSSSTLNYSAGETFTTTSITVTPTVADANATVKVNGVAVTSGSSSGAIILNNGSNIVSVVVTAQDGTINTYSLNIVKSLFSNNADLSALSLSNGTLSPAFSAATTSGYSASVANSVSSITVTPTTADVNATVQVNGVATTSGSASAAVALNVGSNTITTTVNAQDGITQKVYTVTVNRAQSSNANLAALAPSSGTLSPVFASATNNYSLPVANNVTTITLTPTVADGTATVKVNGNTITSGSASSSVSLNVGTNNITTIVTAQDGTINTYTITVIRAQSSNANLSSLVPGSGTLSPIFAASTNNYALSVANGINAISFTPTVADATATVKVNGTAVTSGTASGNINLLVGNNTITTTVTAQDGTINNYIITVTRAASSNNSLSALSISNGTLSPVFASGTNSYNVVVGGSITAVTLSPVVADATATVTVNGNAVTSGSSSAAIPLSLGSNTISTVVTAQNGSANTYTVVVNRQIIAQTITFPAIAAVTYGSVDFAPGATSNNNTISITYSSSNTSVATITAGGNIHIVGAGTASITASQSGNADYTAATPVTQSLTVNTATLTIVAVNQTKVYGTANPAFTLTYSGFVNGDTQASLTTQASASTAATVASGVGNYPITANGAVSVNYTFAYTNGTLSVTPAALNIAANNQTKVYGAANPTFTFTYSGFVNGDTPATLTTQASASTTATASSGVGAYPVTASGAVSANYSISYTVGTLTVTQAALNISANNQTKVYGSANPTLTLTYSGFVNGDTQAGLSAQANANTTATTASGVGTYPITVSGATSTNYTISYTGGTLNVSQATITVTAANQTKVYGAALPALTASYSGFVNGDTQTSLALVPSVSTTATATSAVGTYPITAAGATLVNYTVVSIDGALTVTPAVLTISANNVTATYGSVVINLSPNYSGFVNGDTPSNLTTAPTVSTTAKATSKVGVYPITVSGAASSNYTFVYTGATFTIVPTTLVVTANNLTKIYGAANPVLTVSYSGFVNGDTQTSLTTQPTASTTAVTASLPGTYPITVSGAVSPNYTISYVPGTLTVGVNPRTLTFNPITPQTYGNSDFDPGATVSSGDPIVYTTSDNTIATVVNNKIHIVSAGTVTVYASVASRVNYADVATGSQQLIINKASQVIVFYPIPVQQKGGPPVNLNLTASSGLPVTVMSSDPTTASIDPVTQAISPLGIGSVIITATQAGNVNYLPITATEVLRIQDIQDLVFVRPGFSPNNDGINDVMIIEGITNYTDNDITIVDRNGAKYYHASNYDNTSVVFDGHSNVTGNMVRPGTYFYELNYKVNGQSRRKAGYIIIKY